MSLYLGSIVAVVIAEVEESKKGWDSREALIFLYAYEKHKDTIVGNKNSLQVRNAWEVVVQATRDACWQDPVLLKKYKCSHYKFTKDKKNCQDKLKDLGKKYTKAKDT